MEQASKTRIMVVEDNNVISFDIRRSLEKAGYEIIAVLSSGKDAISTATEKLPDLVIMDIKLKGEIDGIEAANKIRFIGIPVLLISAFEDETNIQRATSTGSVGYLVKPFEDEELVSTIEAVLSTRNNAVV